MLHATRQHAMVVASLVMFYTLDFCVKVRLLLIVNDKWKYDRSHWLRLRPT